MHSKKDIDRFIAFTKRWEGGLSRDPDDPAARKPNPLPFRGQKGWHTNKGITYESWEATFEQVKAQEFYTMTDDQWFRVFKILYWDKVRADEIKSFGVAVYTVGMAWGSGARRAIQLLQRSVNKLQPGALVEDGVIGPKTLAAVNTQDPRQLFDKMLEMREKFFRAIAPLGSPKHKFLKGWLNRLEDYRKEFRP